MRASVFAGALVTALAVTAASATTFTTTIETFDGTLAQSTWRMGSFDAIYAIGGNPGNYLRNPELDAAEPQIVALPTATPFFGDYRAKGVTSVGIDVILWGAQFGASGRPVSLDLNSDMGTPDDTSDDCDLVYVGAKNLPNAGTGWKSYDFKVKSDSTTLPPGWQAVGVCASLSPDEAWSRGITNVDGVRFLFGEPGFFYFFQIWDFGVDNARITFGGR